MLVLGIESSCDETAAAVVANGERILSSVVASQVLTHEKYGGVVPELASREHLRKITPVVDEACRRADVTLPQIEAVAVTEGPGLIGSLLVGLTYGKAVALALGKPLVGVNHLEGHIHAVLLENKMARETGQPVEEVRFPSVTLVVSGGHTNLFRVEAPDMDEISNLKLQVSNRKAEIPNFKSDAARTSVTPTDGNIRRCFSYARLGQTRDDAAGEAFDKVAKLLALGYPGGPVIDRLARFGNPQAIDFGRIRMKANPLDFSFSGLKTAVLYRLRGTALEAEARERQAWRQSRPQDAGRATIDELRAHASQATLDLIASFQEAVVSDLVERTLRAAEAEGAESLLVSGGVACNSRLRERFAETARQKGFPVFFPSPALSTDNAAMIAAAGFSKLAAGDRDGVSLTAHASFPLGA